MDRCWEDKNRMGWKGKESEDRDMERSGERVMEDKGWERG